MSSLSSFSKDWVETAKKRFGNVAWNKQETVQITTLNNLISKFGTPKFCKIDVEGYEYEVLRGLSSKVPYMSIEFMTPENADVVRNCLRHLNSIDSKILINVSLEDTLVFHWENWLSYSESIEILEKEMFNEWLWGDVYIKMS
jgi:hypothetical protein